MKMRGGKEEGEEDTLVHPNLSPLNIPLRRRDLPILQLCGEEFIEVDPERCGLVMITDREMAHDGICARS